MERVLFERAKSGYRAVRGDLVRSIQTRLKATGADPGEVDGIYGRDTEGALKLWQATCGMADSGRLCVASWSKLVEAPLPSMLERCLQLTSDFEGHGYAKVVGNFDGAWLTWGIIGFTLRNGEIQKILAKVRSEHPGLLRDVLGPLEAVLLRVLAGGTDTQEGWANDISVGSNHYRVLPEWEEAFANLGTCPEVRRIQLEGVENYWRLAQRNAAQFGLKSERGLALCFDIAVQNGGISQAEERRIRRLFAETPPSSELDRRVVIADVVAEDSKPRFVEDVRLRKRAIAVGEGMVHGARYAIREWGIDEFDA